MIAPVELRPGVLIFQGDCLAALKRIRSNSVHAVVTDPPAGINFMSNDWDEDKGGRDAWIAWMTLVAAENLRVLVPGGHALVWALPRTCHWTAMGWENARFEVRDRVSHIFGSGFPKSHNISDALDKLAGLPKSDTPQTEEAKRWEGWGTALKPAIEDWWLFRKPIEEKTVALNVVTWGTGALNIRDCMVPLDGESVTINRPVEWTGFGQLERPDYEAVENDAGRWPAHLVHDGSQCVVEQFPVTSSGKPSGKKSSDVGFTKGVEPGYPVTGFGDMGSTARFFNSFPLQERKPHAARFVYFAKPTKAERNFGIDGPTKDPAVFTHRPTKKSNPEKWKNIDSPYGRASKRKNNHPTVKRKALMMWLIRLITPPGGIVLDSFMGSGSTGVAAIELGHPFIGIEQGPDSFEVATMRILAAPAPLLPDTQLAILDQEGQYE